jgi:hypothetical protein
VADWRAAHVPPELAELIAALRRLVDIDALSADARAEYDSILQNRDADAVERAREAVYHAKALARRAEPFDPWPRLTDAERDEVHRLLDDYSDERAGRVARHRQRLVSVAWHLGREVRAYRDTLADAEVRLDRLALILDEDEPLIALIPYRDAVVIVRNAFAEGFGGSSCPS